MESLNSKALQNLLRDAKADTELYRSITHDFHRAKRKVAEITARIPHYQGSLTVHDIGHTDALWEMVDLLVYRNDEQFRCLGLNLLEGYVLGLAILIHDAGLSGLALRGGVRELVNMPEYDSQLRLVLRVKFGREPSNSELESYSVQEHGMSDGLVGRLLRLNHAHLAARIVLENWNVDGDQWKLIENDELRHDWAPIIGEIGKSHHWPVKDIKQLPDLMSCRAGLGVEWTVRPQYLACILRCADALQLDYRRAPLLTANNSDFPALSARHWMAQAKIRRIAADQEYIKVFSDVFRSDESDYWWQAYELFAYAQEELDRVDTFLRQSDYPRFVRRRILGIEDPETFSAYMRLEGEFHLRPRIKIGAPTEIIARLGGDQLYGSERCPPIRELMMNARDAVSLRRSVEQQFEPRILVKLSNSSGGKSLSILDNGIGMDRYALSEVLLDFGSSFWCRDEGLRAETVGVYGIGFFSVFMWADVVSVVSRKLGSTKCHRLVFSNGLRERPNIYESDDHELEGWASTTVTLKLKNPQQLQDFMNNPTGGCVLRNANLFAAVAGIAPIDDIGVSVDDGGERRSILQGSFHTLDGYEVQRRLRFDYKIAKDIGEPSSRPFIVFSQPIFDDNGDVIGRGWPANVGNGSGRLRSVVTVKGFPTATHVPDFAGGVEGRSTNAARDRYEPIASATSWRNWFTSCQRTLGSKPADFVWGRWSLRCGVDPKHARFFRRFSEGEEADEGGEVKAILSLPEVLAHREIQYIQLDPSIHSRGFPEFFKNFVFLELLRDQCSLTQACSWLRSIAPPGVTFNEVKLPTPVSRHKGRLLFEVKRRGKTIANVERAIKIERLNRPSKTSNEKA